MMFNELFAITCNHQYFAGGQCSDLQIIPTAQCNTLLKKYKMLFKQKDISSYTILLQQTNNKVIVPSSPLTFFVCITGNQFYNYTKYPATTNTADAVKDTGDNGNTLLFSGVEADTDASFVITTAAKPSPSSYQNQNLFGIISITPPKTFCNFKLFLEAIAIKWRYYIVADKNVKDVEVKEKESSGNASEIITFKSIAGAKQKDAIYTALKISFPDALIFLEESDAEVLSAQKTSKNIQCWNVTDKNHKLMLMDNLPVPSLRDYGKKVIYVRSINNDS